MDSMAIFYVFHHIYRTVHDGITHPRKTVKGGVMEEPQKVDNYVIPNSKRLIIYVRSRFIYIRSTIAETLTAMKYTVPEDEQCPCRCLSPRQTFDI
jgi:hypothetical protein